MELALLRIQGVLVLRTNHVATPTRAVAFDVGRVRHAAAPAVELLSARTLALLAIDALPIEAASSPLRLSTPSPAHT